MCRAALQNGYQGQRSTKNAALAQRSHPIINDQRTSIDRSYTTVVCHDVVQSGVLVPGLAGTLKLTGVLDGLPDLLLGFDDLEGKTHRHVPSDMAV